MCVRIVSAIVPIKSVRKNLRSKLINCLLSALKDELGKKYPDYYQFAMFQPWGDFYIPCALLEEFKKETVMQKFSPYVLMKIKGRSCNHLRLLTRLLKSILQNITPYFQLILLKNVCKN